MRRNDVEAAERAGSRIYKQSAAAAEPLAERDVRFVASTSEPDREGDVIVTSGIETEAYQRNPVVPFAHDYRSLPIGRAMKIERQPERLLVTVRFAPAEANPLAEQVLALVRGGFLNAMSIGFRPLEWKYDETRKGVNFYRTELLECSVVPVPANAEALVAASARGIDVSLLKSWASGVLAEGRAMPGRDDGPGLLIREAGDERIEVDPDELAAAIADMVHDTISRGVRKALNELRGRIDDSDEWVPPPRTRTAPVPKLGGGIGRLTVQTETGLQSTPGAFRR